MSSYPMLMMLMQTMANFAARWQQSCGQSATDDSIQSEFPINHQWQADGYVFRTWGYETHQQYRWHPDGFDHDTQSMLVLRDLDGSVTRLLFSTVDPKHNQCDILSYDPASGELAYIVKERASVLGAREEYAPRHHVKEFGPGTLELLFETTPSCVRGNQDPASQPNTRVVPMAS